MWKHVELITLHEAKKWCLLVEPEALSDSMSEDGETSLPYVAGRELSKPSLESKLIYGCKARTATKRAKWKENASCFSPMLSLDKRMCTSLSFNGFSHMLQKLSYTSAHSHLCYLQQQH